MRGRLATALRSRNEPVVNSAPSTASRVIGAHVCHLGTADASFASPREVYRFCLLVNARSVIAAHDHPSGNLEPSSADVQVTRQIKAAGEVAGVTLPDSVVCGYDGRYTSLAERGLMQPSEGPGRPNRPVEDRRP